MRSNEVALAGVMVVAVFLSLVRVETCAASEPPLAFAAMPSDTAGPSKAVESSGQFDKPLGNPSSPSEGPWSLSDWLTVAANSDFSFRKTQFFEKDHDTAFLQWDSRLELWLPPYRHSFSWGPYVRLAGVVSDRDVPFENAPTRDSSFDVVRTGI